MIPELDHDNWQEVFGEPTVYSETEYPAQWPHGAETQYVEAVGRDPFTRADVAEVRHLRQTHASAASDWDGACVVRLKDGRWAALSGWCDYTGWGCQDGVSRTVAATYDEVVRFGLTDEDRTQFGIEQPS